MNPAERTVISSFYWDGEKKGRRPAPQQKNINKAIKDNRSKLTTINEITAEDKNDAIKRQLANHYSSKNKK